MGCASLRGHFLHRRNGVLLGDLARSVDIAFQKVNVLVLTRERLKRRSDGMAWATPGESFERQENSA